MTCDPRLKKSIGIFLIILSCVLWGGIVLLPFLGLSAGVIAAATTALVVAGEVAFWVGLLLAGREAWEKIKFFFLRKNH